MHRVNRIGIGAAVAERTSNKKLAVRCTARNPNTETGERCPCTDGACHVRPVPARTGQLLGVIVTAVAISWRFGCRIKVIATVREQRIPPQLSHNLLVAARDTGIDHADCLTGRAAGDVPRRHKVGALCRSRHVLKAPLRRKIRIGRHRLRPNGAIRRCIAHPFQTRYCRRHRLGVTQPHQLVEAQQFGATRQRAHIRHPHPNRGQQRTDSRQTRFTQRCGRQRETSVGFKLDDQAQHVPRIRRLGTVAGWRVHRLRRRRASNPCCQHHDREQQR